MKLSILIFVLTTIIYGCQCAPTPDWQGNLHERLEVERQQREENLGKLHERLEAERQEREENLRKLHERLEAERQERNENLRRDMENLHKKLHEDRERRNQELEAAKQQIEERDKQSGTASGEGYNGYSSIVVGNYLSMTTYETVNGNLVERTIEERVLDDFKIRTVTKRTPALNKTDVKFYRCGLQANSECILISQTN